MNIILNIFFVYIASLHISLAAMEGLCWLAVLPATFMALKQKKFLWPSKYVLIAFGGLIAVATISFWLNIKKPDEFFDYIFDFRWMIAYILWLQFYNVLFDKISFPKLLMIGQAVLIIAGFYSFYQFFTAHDPFRPHVVFHFIFSNSKFVRPNSFFGLPTTYAYASAMFLALSMSFLFLYPQVKSKTQLWIRRIYFIISPINILIAFTRAAWIASITSSLLILRKCNKKIFIKTVLALVLFTSVFYASFSPFRDRVNSIFDSNYVANHNRIYLWKANMIIFSEYPIFGIGFEENRKQIDGYLNRLNQPNVMRNHPHNTYINFLAGLGVTGFSFFMLFLLYNLRNTFKQLQASTNDYHKAIFLGSLGLQLVLLIGAATECTFEDNELAHQYILFTAVVEYLRLRLNKHPQIINQASIND